MLQQFISFFRDHHIDIKNGRFLVAVSGGVDSVVLTELCRQAGSSFALAHCNFNLRGEESNRDEAFVRSLAKELQTEVFVASFDTAKEAAAGKGSIQQTARSLRYQWFGDLQKQYLFDYTLLAHHADDNIETVLMNFFRGCGLPGLTGIPEQSFHQGRCLRPLLSVRRKDIEIFATENKLSWIEDSSNASTKYTRNFFRHELLPQLQKVYPQADENVLSNIERFKQIEAFYNLSVNSLKTRLIESEGPTIKIAVKKLLQQNNKAIIYEIIKDYGFTQKQLPDVLNLTRTTSGKFVANSHFQIIRHGAWLLIVPVTEKSETVAIGAEQNRIHFKGGSISIVKIPVNKFRPDAPPVVAQIDAARITYPLLLRPWKAGDHFYPLGMTKKKKLSRFFIDARLSKADKEGVWVLESGGKIIWVVGMRIDNRMKITTGTKDILVLTYQK